MKQKCPTKIFENGQLNAATNVWCRFGAAMRRKSAPGLVYSC
jgi:hypothetical protein